MANLDDIQIDRDMRSRKFLLFAIVSFLGLLGIMLSLFLEQRTNGNFLLTIGFSFAILLFVLSSNFYRGWIILLIASTLSTIRMKYFGFDFRPDELVFIWMSIIWIGAFLMGKVRTHHTPLFIPVIGTIAVNLLSTFLYAPDKSFGYQSSLLLAVYLFIYFITFNLLSENIRLLKAAPILLIIVGVAQAVYGLIGVLSHIGGINLGGFVLSSAGFGAGASGGFQEDNIMGSFLAVIALVIMAHIALRTGWKRGGLYLVLALSVTLITLSLTFTRAAWIGFALGAVFLLFILRPAGNIFNPKILALLMSLIIGFFVFLMPFGNYISTSSGGGSNGFVNRIANLANLQGSGQGRTQVISLAFTRWEKSPLLGRGTYSLPQIGTGRISAGSWLYSSLVQSLHDTGLVGLFFMLWIYGGGIVIGLKGIRESTTRYWKATIAGSTVGWFALIIASQASSSAWLSFSWIILGLLVAWSVNVRRLESVSD